jgi:hypothetical protein
MQVSRLSSVIGRPQPHALEMAFRPRPHTALTETTKFESALALMEGNLVVAIHTKPPRPVSTGLFFNLDGRLHFLADTNRESIFSSHRRDNRAPIRIWEVSFLIGQWASTRRAS